MKVIRENDVKWHTLTPPKQERRTVNGVLFYVALVQLEVSPERNTSGVQSAHKQSERWAAKQLPMYL